LLIGTPGRVADHIRRENIYTKNVHTLILDEFDKSLETGFENEMREIMNALPMLKRKVLTSATQKVEIPAFTRIKNPMKLDYLSEGVARLKVEVVVSHSKNKLIMLERLLGYLGDKNGIVFCSLKDTILEVSDDLQRKNIGHTSFYGGLEQIDRERALMKFRNGTERILVASDLAARGIDVPELDYIIHFEIPEKADEFTHRNGRTARMNRNGRAIVIKWENE
ncbi:MAG TPA: helicase, partial [Flavobacteriales bacterium]|nr:helicase [Flavobacteriales bacterium]